MFKKLTYILTLIGLIANYYGQVQSSYFWTEEISFRESFHQNVKINTDSTLTYVKYNGDYSSYEEYTGKVYIQADGSYKMNLMLRKDLKTVERHAPFQFVFSINTDSAYTSKIKLNIWYFDEEEIPLSFNFSKLKQSSIDTVLNLQANNGLLIYTPFWNPTNTDEIVHKVAWNKAPKWKLYHSNTQKSTLYFRLEDQEVEFFSKD